MGKRRFSSRNTDSKQVASLASRHELKTVRGAFFLKLEGAGRNWPILVRMNPPASTGENPPHPKDRIFVVFLVLLLLIAVGVEAARSARQQRWALVILMFRIDAAAAPDEAVVLDDRWLAFEIRHGAPAGLQVPLVVLQKPEDALRGEGEVVLVTTETDPALARLRSEGYGVLVDTMAVPSDLYAGRRVMVFFVTRPTSDAAGASNAIGEKP